MPRDKRPFSVQSLLVPEHSGFYAIVIFWFCKEIYKRRNGLQVCMCFRKPHFIKIVYSRISSEPNSFKTLLCKCNFLDCEEELLGWGSEKEMGGWLEGRAGALQVFSDFVSKHLA